MSVSLVDSSDPEFAAIEADDTLEDLHAKKHADTKKKKEKKKKQKQKEVEDEGDSSSDPSDIVEKLTDQYLKKHPDKEIADDELGETFAEDGEEGKMIKKSDEAKQRRRKKIGGNALAKLS